MYAHATGTQSLVVGSEHILAAITVPGCFQLIIDRNALTATDVLEMYVRQIVLTGGTKRELWRWHFHGVAPTWDILGYTDWFANELGDSGSLEFCVKQTFGTGRSLPWKVMNSDATQGYQKGQAIANFVFPMYDATGTLKTGLSSFTQQISKDGGAEAALGGTITEIGTTGYYKIDSISASETNADEVVLRFAASGANATLIKLRMLR